MAKKGGSKPKGVASIDATQEDFTTGATWKTQIDCPMFAEVGNLTPASKRAMSIKKNNMLQQVQWAQEYLKDVEEYEDGRKEIEEIRSQINKKFFSTEKAIDEYVLASLLAKEGYDAHYREWTARKALEIGLITHVANEEIRAVADEFTQKTLEWKSKTDARISKYQAESKARIEQAGSDRDVTAAQEKALAAKRLKLFTSGAPMDEVNAVGSASNAVVTVSASGGRGTPAKSLLDVFSFRF